MHLIDLFDYKLPDRLIAQRPAEPRDSSRLLVVHRATGTFEHRKFTDLPQYLNSDDALVVNNSYVMKARLCGQRVIPQGAQYSLGGKTEFLMLKALGPKTWEGMFHASAKHKPGVCFEVPTPDGKGLRGTLIRGASDSPHGTVVVEFNRDPIESGAGEIPLPHYIKRDNRAVDQQTQRPENLSRPVLDQAPSGTLSACEFLNFPIKNFNDKESYQTKYAKIIGSAAAPTAGFHFTDSVINQIKERGVQWEEVTLHVGLGTFRPVKSVDIREHTMHEEFYQISPEVANRLNVARTQGKRIMCVGTTSVRTLESAWRAEHTMNQQTDLKSSRAARRSGGMITAGAGATSLFIRPKDYTFKVVDSLLTNFHLPKSTLLILVCALAGRELILAAYEEAIKLEYRFFSYGDAMLIL